jgi:hypothetical protein
MADEPFSLHIDTDWKKQAQEEKRRLAEEQAKRLAPATPAPAATGPATTTTPAAGQRATAAASRSTARELPPASIGSLIQTLMTQALFYMGELGQQGAGEGVNLDMAKHQIDTLGVLEEKTRGNLTPDEQRLLDAALYETRMRFVSVASQYL